MTDELLYLEDPDEQVRFLRAWIATSDVMAEGIPGINKALDEVGLPLLETEADFYDLFDIMAPHVLKRLKLFEMENILAELRNPENAEKAAEIAMARMTLETIKALAERRLAEQLGGQIQ